MENAIPPNISNLLTLMVTWDNSFHYQNICVIANKDKRENYRQSALFLFQCLNDVFWQKLQAAKAIFTDTDLAEQAFSSVERDVYEIIIVGI